MNMKNLLPFTNGFHCRYHKSKIPKERRVFIPSGFLLPVFFLYFMQMLNRSVDFPLTSLLSIHGHSTKDEAIVALWLVKDFIIEREGIDKN